MENNLERPKVTLKINNLKDFNDQIEKVRDLTKTLNRELEILTNFKLEIESKKDGRLV